MLLVFQSRSQISNIYFLYFHEKREISDNNFEPWEMCREAYLHYFHDFFCCFCYFFMGIRAQFFITVWGKYLCKTEFICQMMWMK